MKCEKNEFAVVTLSGVSAAPYELWVGDKWKCMVCGKETVLGYGSGPTAEAHHDGFAREVKRWDALRVCEYWDVTTDTPTERVKALKHAERAAEPDYIKAEREEKLATGNWENS